MKKSILGPLAVAAAALAFGAGSANADYTCPNSFNICVDFSLVPGGGGSWTLTTAYVSSPSGVLTATGIYYNAGKTAPDFGIGNLLLTSPTTGWQVGAGCGDLNLNNGTTDLLSACGSTLNGVNAAVGAGSGGGGPVVITFTANSAFATAYGAGQIDYRAHVQSYGPTSCSIKLDTGVGGNIGSAGTDCVPTTVPEPISMVLLGSGLLGLGGVRMRRRNRRQ